MVSIKGGLKVGTSNRIHRFISDLILLCSVCTRYRFMATCDRSRDFVYLFVEIFQRRIDFNRYIICTDLPANIMDDAVLQSDSGNEYQAVDVFA